VSLHPNVSSSLEDNDVSSFARPLWYLHTLLRCFEAKMKTWRSQNFWENLEKIGKTFFQSIRAKKGKILDKISSELEVLKGDGVKIVLVKNNLSKYDYSN
jgi:hypothetical protein